jgi:hypothetical protein
MIAVPFSISRPSAATQAARGTGGAECETTLKINIGIPSDTNGDVDLTKVLDSVLLVFRMARREWVASASEENTASSRRTSNQFSAG